MGRACEPPNKVDIRLVMRSLSQPQDEGLVRQYQPARSFRVGKRDRFRAILREHHKPFGGMSLRIETKPDLFQHPRGGRMQPLALQFVVPVGFCFEQRHPSAPTCMGKRTQTAHWASADYCHVIAPRIGAVQWNDALFINGLVVVGPTSSLGNRLRDLRRLMLLVAGGRPRFLFGNGIISPQC